MVKLQTLRTVGEANREFMHAIGVAITDWAHIEMELFRICDACLGTDSVKASIVFYRTPTIEGRISLTDELARTVLPRPQRKDGGHPPKSLKEWEQLVKDIKLALPFRNQIAHSPTSTKIDLGSIEEREPDSEVWVESHTSAMETLRGRATHRILLKDIRLHHDTITDLINRLRNQNEFVFAKLLKSPLPQSPLQSTTPATLEPRMGPSKEL